MFYIADNPSLFVPVIFQKPKSNESKSLMCGSWDHDTWKFTQAMPNLTSDSIILCQVDIQKKYHALVDTNSIPRNISTPKLLTIRMEEFNIRSTCGCLLSLFGLSCIFLTALFFEEWRSEFTNRLLLNICVVLTFVMSLFLLINMPNIRNALQKIENRRQCLGSGAFLQYIMLVLFLWTLFISMLQYFRYASVFGTERPRHFMLISALAAWSLPLIPTILVATLDPKSFYASVENGWDSHILCHPTGISWYLGVLLPICLIMFANAAILGYISLNIRRASTEFHLTTERAEVIYQVRQAILLIFVLSISWIIGMVGHVLQHGLLEQIFCFTSTLQGFFLFLHFVVVNKSARSAWFVYFCKPSWPKPILQQPSTSTSPDQKQ